ncbi:MAG: type IV pilus assembly protein PilC, partial [Parcubacteria group bacterium Gr01-1014_73]
IPIVKALEITSSVVGDEVYKEIILEVTEQVKSGSTLSDALSRHPEIPSIMVQMTKVGEESGELGNILKTLAKFYQREVTNAVDMLIGMIEPVMIIALAIGVGFLLAAVLMPIYNIAGGIQ